MSLDKREKDAMAVAYLVHQGKHQSEIQEMLHLSSQTEVSRLLALAKSEGWLKLQLNLPPNINEEEIVLRAFPDRDTLKQKLNNLARANGGEPVRHLHIVYSSEKDILENRLKQFGRQAAEHIVQLIRQDKTKTCAVAWGRTIKSFIDGLSLQSKKGHIVQFIPIAGEPFEFPVSGVSPTRAAQLLSQIFNENENGDGEKGYYSLNGVAARIPKHMDNKSKIIKEFVSICKDYEAIFEGESPLIERVDMVVTGIGNAQSSKNDPWFNEAKKLEDINDLEAFAAGNIGGVLLPKCRDNKDHNKKVNEINGRWLGIQKKHFEQIAKKASPGVVVLAVEPEKAPIVMRAIGMINHLIIDQQLAKAIIDTEIY